MHRVDGAGHVNNTFTKGDPAVPTPATEVTDDILNALQEEIANVCEEGASELDKADNTQLITKIQDLIAAALAADASKTVKGIIELSTDAEAQALTDAVRAITPASLGAAFGGGNQSIAVAGYQKLPGGLIMQWLLQPFPSGTSSSFSWPIAFPNQIFTANANDQGTLQTALSIAITTTGGTVYASSFPGGAFIFAVGY